VQFSGSNAFIVMGWGGHPDLRAGIGPKSRLFGTLLLATPNDLVFPVTDIADNERRHNPAGETVDSNPYGVLVLSGKRIVADAGANALVVSGSMDLLQPFRDRTFAVLAPTAFGTQPVPTTVAKGPGGDVFVGEATPYLTGLTAVVDITFDENGTLYIVEIASGLVPGPGAEPGVGNGRLPQQFRHLPGWRASPSRDARLTTELGTLSER
jgi:hypothetical protein